MSTYLFFSLHMGYLSRSFNDILVEETIRLWKSSLILGVIGWRLSKKAEIPELRRRS